MTYALLTVLGYFVCGLLLTAWVLVLAWRADPIPLFKEGEWQNAVICVLLMSLTWPFWLIRMLEAEL